MSKLTLDILFQKANKPTNFELNALKIENIKPCPFCACKEIYFMEDIFKEELIEVWVRCSDCGADSPPFKNRLGALKKWQGRK